MISLIESKILGILSSFQRIARADAMIRFLLTYKSEASESKYCQKVHQKGNWMQISHQQIMFQKKLSLNLTLWWVLSGSWKAFSWALLLWWVGTLSIFSSAFYLKVSHCCCGVTFLPLPRLSILPWAHPWEFFIAFHFTSSSSSLILIHHVYSHIFTAEGPHSVAKKELIVFYFFSVCAPIVKSTCCDIRQ